MNVNELLDTIEDALEESANVPLSGGKRIVDVEQIRDYLDEVRAALPGELRQAQQIVNDRAQIVDSANAQAQAIVDSAVIEANNIRQSSVQYTDDMLRSLQTIIKHSMEGAQGRFDGFMNSMQSSYDIVSSNRNELAGSVVTELEDNGEAAATEMTAE